MVKRRMTLNYNFLKNIEAEFVNKDYSVPPHVVETISNLEKGGTLSTNEICMLDIFSNEVFFKTYKELKKTEYGLICLNMICRFNSLIKNENSLKSFITNLYNGDFIKAKETLEIDGTEYVIAALINSNLINAVRDMVKLFKSSVDNFFKYKNMFKNNKIFDYNNAITSITEEQNYINFEITLPKLIGLYITNIDKHIECGEEDKALIAIRKVPDSINHFFKRSRLPINISEYRSFIRQVVKVTNKNFYKKYEILM